MEFYIDEKVLEPISPSVPRDEYRVFLKIISVILGTEKRDVVNSMK